MKTEFEFVSGVVFVSWAVFVSRAVCRSVHLFVGPRPKDGLTASIQGKSTTVIMLREMGYSSSCYLTVTSHEVLLDDQTWSPLVPTARGTTQISTWLRLCIANFVRMGSTETKLGTNNCPKIWDSKIFSVLNSGIKVKHPHANLQFRQIWTQE